MTVVVSLVITDRQYRGDFTPVGDAKRCPNFQHWHVPTSMLAYTTPLSYTAIHRNAGWARQTDKRQRKLISTDAGRPQQLSREHSNPFLSSTRKSSWSSDTRLRQYPDMDWFIPRVIGRRSRDEKSRVVTLSDVSGPTG